MVKLLAAKASIVQRHFHRHARHLGLMLLAAWPLSRVVALKIAALVTRNDRVSKSAQEWAEIWRRRGEWRQGWRSETGGGVASSGYGAEPSGT